MKKIISILIALVLCMLLSVSVFAGTFTAPAAKSIALDGVITEEEWGAPILKGVNIENSTNGSVDPVLGFWQFDESYPGNESYDLYVNNDSENIYLGLVMHDTVVDTHSDGSWLWQHQNFTFTIGTPMGTGYTTVEYEGQTYEQYTGYRIGLLNNGVEAIETFTLGIDAKDLNTNQYKVVYDEANKTMTYEVAVPYSLTTIDLNKSNSMALSAVIPFQYASNVVSNSTDGASRFVIGTGAAFCGGPENFAHNGQTIIVTLNDANAVAGITQQEVAADTEEEQKEDAVENVETTTETLIVETVEKDIVWKTTTQVVIIIISGIVVLLCAAVVVLLLAKRPPRKKTKIGRLL